MFLTLSIYQPPLRMSECSDYDQVDRTADLLACYQMEDEVAQAWVDQTYSDTMINNMDMNTDMYADDTRDMCDLIDAGDFEQMEFTNNFKDKRDNLSSVLQRITGTSKKVQAKIVQRLTCVLNRIGGLTKKDQAKILRKGFASVDSEVMETLMQSDIDTVYEGKLATGIIDHLKKVSFPLYRKEDRDAFCALVYSVCGENIQDEEFFSWFCRKIGKRKYRVADILNDYLTVSTVLETRGRKGLSLASRQSIYDAWHEYSIVTVDRRSGRDQIKIKVSDFACKDLSVPDDIVLEEFLSKRNQRMVKSTRRVFTKTVRQLRTIVEAKIGNRISTGSVWKNKPFYVISPSEREKASCLCKFCLNLRLKFDELQTHLKDEDKKMTSMSEYFAHGIECMKDENGYYQLKCISSECDNDNCRLKPIFQSDDFEIPNPNIVCYGQYVSVIEEYVNKDGEKKQCTRTIRQSFSEPLELFKANLEAKGSLYLLHRLECKNDQFHWPQILDRTDLGHVYHMDYSENISCSPKFEPQDAHFSGKQTSLHCTVDHEPSGDVSYAYHLSDNKTHDATFTNHVICDLVERFSKDDKMIRIKTDNCATQYCSLHVFEAYKQLSIKLEKPIILHYGVNGHGRGLVDAMSGFGVKSPLRRAIVTDDFMFNSAQELENFLKEHFMNDDRKSYVTIPSEDLVEERKNRGKGIKIKGCLKSRMISFFPEGQILSKRHLCSCDHCIIGKFNQCGEDDVDMINNDEIVHLDDTDDAEPDTFTMVDVNSFIAMCSLPNAIEPFYVMKIIEKTVAEDDMVDIYGHTIQKGSKYLKGYYLEKIDQKRDKIVYKQLKKVVYIYPWEIFCSVDIDTDLRMDIADYINVSDIM